MKATIIESHEYRANDPTVFIYIDGGYYGDLLYANHRKLPPIDYWRTAMSSDESRGFTLTEIEITSDQFERIKQLQAVCDANDSMVIRTSWPHISTKGKSKEQYKAEIEAQMREVRAEDERNQPFYKAFIAAYRLRLQIFQSLSSRSAG